ncbi:MAG: outer membrane beta-barrel protein [Ignavibacteriaceae bacterium]|nr:outer membrane beta-barrel protein [Ignavibacteriaceae bacterium]
MKKTNIISFAVMFLLLIPTFTSAQLVKIGVGGGLTQVLAPDALTKEVSEGGLGYSTEWNAGVIGKVDLPLIPFTPRAFILYHSLSGSGSTPPELFKAMQAEGDLEYSQSILEIGVGAQYNFIPAPLGFDPYIALDLSFNSFGKSKVNDLEIDGSDGFSRFGGGIGVGTEISIIPVVNLDLYLSYKMFNLTGKEDGEETISAVTLDAFIIFNFL